MLTNSQIAEFSNLLNKVSINDEFEVMFNNYKSDNKLSIIKFMNILKYLKYKSKSDNIELINTTTLDIIHDVETNNFYRITISGINNINDFLNLVHQRTNHVIFSILLTQSEFLQNENFKYIKKIKNPADIIDVDQYDIRIRKSTEEPLDDKDIQKIINLGLNSSSKFCYRYKCRISLKLIDDENQCLVIDATTIQYNTNVNNIKTTSKNYELELDYTLKKNGKVNKNISEKIINEITIIKKILESTDILIPKSEITSVLESYKKYVLINEPFSNSIYTMQPISAEVQHILDKIPHYYSVSDKADGEKVQLFVHNKQIYIISCNLNIKKTKYSSSLNNTILEGEIYYNTKDRKYLFLGFDCLIFNGKDVRNEISLKKRVEYIYLVCKDINPNIYKLEEFTGKYKFEDQENFYKKEISNFHDNLNNQINKLKQNEIFFHQKLFIFPIGASASEVYLFAYLIWDYYSKTNMSYKLDGIIFTGIEQKYTKDKKDQKYPIYKYKPPITNSIDIFINFQRKLEENKFLEVYDNSIGNVTNQVYRITNLFVGDCIGNKEVPVPFMKEENNHEAYFPLINDEVRDQDGNYVEDNTVVEVVYNNDPSIPHQYRWSILRTRWDKTEDVYKHQKRYGNFKDVAIRNWKSIKEAVNIDEIRNLSLPSHYIQQQKILQQRLNASVITSERQQDIYYQKITNLCKKMREFHNWIKSIIIYSYCSPYKLKNSNDITRTSVLDIGCARGGDILKFYHAKVGEYVGIDIDYYTIFSSTDGAVSRYNEFKKKFPGFGKVQFIHADGAVPFESKKQENKLPNMTEENKQLIDKIFKKNKQFDCISSMMAIHYLFESDITVNNLIENIKTHLKPNGYVIFTLFDANLVMDKMGDKNTFTAFYTDDDGSRKKLFEIIRKFDDTSDINKIGLPIDVHLAWIMQENKYETEYLVTPSVMDSVMNRANCRLIETDTFANIYNMNLPYFTDVIEHEENPKNYKFYKKVADFYGELKNADKDSKIFSFLNRYYIYQKMQ